MTKSLMKRESMELEIYAAKMNACIEKIHVLESARKQLMVTGDIARLERVIAAIKKVKADHRVWSNIMYQREA